MNAWSKLKTYVGGSPAPANSAALGKRKRSKEDKPPLSPKRAKTAAAEAAHVPTPARLSPVIEETDEDDREETTARQTRQATRATIVEAASQTEPPVQDGTGIPEDNRSNSVILGQAVDELIAEMKGKADAENKAASGQKALPATTQAKSKSSSLATAPKATTTSLPKRKFENKPSGWDQLTPASKWDVMPNLRARELLAAHPASSEAIIKAEISEPEYALRDVEIRDALWQIMDEMSGFTKKFFAFECHHKDNVIPEDWFTRLASQTAKIIGCVASDGPSGVDGWHDLFIDPEKRCALICAIIGNILVEQVLQHPFFGANKPFAASSSPSISQLEEKHRNDNGFDRKKHFAAAIKNSLQDEDTQAIRLPPNFRNHVNHIVAAIWKHIKPFEYLQTPSPKGPTLPITSPVFNALHSIVTQAGLLSLHMHMDAHTQYRFEPVLSEDRYSGKTMQLFNERTMHERDPYLTAQEQSALSKTEQARRAALSVAEKTRARSDEILVHITILPKLTTYRRGGWEAARSTPSKPVYEKRAFAHQGFRTCMLAQAWVQGRWGQERELKGEMDEETGKKIHGEAWRGGGFVEFKDVGGVIDWFALEKKFGGVRGTHVRRGVDVVREVRGKGVARAC